MAWTASEISRQFVADVFEDTAAFDLGAAGVDAFLSALYDNDITPNKDASAANYAYNADQWTSAGNEVFEAGQWAQGGVALANADITTPTSGVVMFDGDNTSSGSAADLANVYGAFTYDTDLASPVADQGVCHNYFGGSNSVVNGTFIVAWHTNGLFRFTV